MNRTKILIADNSPTYKKMFGHMFSFELKHVLITTVATREELLMRTRLGSYEIIVIDAELAFPKPAELLREIIRIIPKAIILITARPSKTNGDLFAEALTNGAAAYLEKPIYDSYGDNIAAVRNKVKDIIKILHEIRKGKGRQTEIQSQSFSPELVVVAASTGGPKALEHIFSKMNPSFSLPILVVQHILPHFAEALAENLDSKTELTVKIAEDGERIDGGKVYIAQSGLHMKLDAKRSIHLENSPAVNGIKPAADVLFESVSEINDLKGVLALVLTGMGYDGVRGLGLLKQRQSCFCLTQSEKTCIVYGMPRAAQESGLSDMIVDLDDIAEKVQSFDVQIRKKD